MISRNTIEKVFEAARVEEVIGEFVQLKKSGSNLKGLSPFSDEKSPSFMVSPVKQIWKDFSSGKGGNAVTFLMEHEHYSYPEAIKYLAKKYQIEIEETQQSQEQKEQANERESLYLVSEYAQSYYQDILFNSEEGKAIGLSYFKERGFTDATIKRFGLGYNLNNWDAFTKTALKNGYELDFLEKTGLTIVKEGGAKTFDRFKGRVLFPIHSMSGRVLGFGGRILTNDKKAAKYLNSPESDIYHKSKILYGIKHAKQSIAKEDNCYLVEGYTDVISMSQAGVENVVASSGTALTSDQIRLINRLTKNITILFDGDAAGIRASIRGIDLILEQGMNVKVLLFPEGEDPDSFAKSVTPEALKAHLAENTQDFINFKVSLLLEDAKNDPIKKAGLIRDIVVSISKIPDRIQQEVYIQECATIMHISENVLFNELAQLLKKNQRDDARKPIRQPSFEVIKEQPTQKVDIDELKKYELELLKILILYGNDTVDFIDFVASEEQTNEDSITLEKVKFTNTVAKEIYLQLHDDEIEFTDQKFQALYYEIITQINQQEKVDTDIFVQHENTVISNLVTDILMEDEKYSLSDWERKNIIVKDKKATLSKLVLDAIYNLRRVLIEKKINTLVSELSSAENSRPSLEEVVNYTQLKQLLYDRLQRVV